MIIDQRTHKIKNSKLKNEIINFSSEIGLLLEKNKYTKEFLNDFIDSYSTEQLLTIINKIRKEIYKRERSGLNNER